MPKADSVIWPVLIGVMIAFNLLSILQWRRKNPGKRLIECLELKQSMLGLGILFMWTRNLRNGDYAGISLIATCLAFIGMIIIGRIQAKASGRKPGLVTDIESRVNEAREKIESKYVDENKEAESESSA